MSAGSRPLAELVQAPDHHPLSAGEPPFAGLVRFAGLYSPYLRQLAGSDPARLDRLAAGEPQAANAAIVAAQRAVGCRFAAGELSRDEAMRELRRNKSAHALLVSLADLGRVWNVEEVTLALSDFADASVRSAVEIALAELAMAGKLPAFAPGADLAGSGLVVLALGKHGAGELNFSSDVDLVVFYDPKSEAASGSPEAPAKLYTRLAQSVARLLQERTVDGYVHRVDYRLRPDPASTPPAVSLPGAFVYYESVGQNWERAAMIKARPIAGDVALGERFLADLAPFIWRKYFDFASIADIHAMKRQIHAVRGHGEIAVASHDIKLGRGGIREIEFFVQTQQLVFGGRRPKLRGRRTLDMLGALHDEGWITAEARDEMAEAYRFLRTVEHRLQMVADEQTQRLPSRDDELAAFARFCGYEDLPAFASALTRRAQRVQHHYGLLFEEGPELASDLGDLVFTGASVDPGTVETLRRLGFRDPELAAETVRGWHFGRRAAVTSARAREVLTELTPALLAALGGSADPDGALARLDRAFARMPAAVELLTILRSHERLRLLFADLLGSAPRLAETVAVSPHVLDAILDPSFAAPARDEAAAEAEIRGLVGTPGSTEEFLDRVRDAFRQVHFATGSRLLSGVISPAEAGMSFAAIAQGVVRLCLEWAARAFAEEHGTVPGARMAVLGLGRLGVRDLTAGSDLDLVVLYDFDEARRTSDGRRPLDAVVYHTRLTQRLIAALTAPTRRGRLYEVDMRLRPSGTKGPVASQYRGFIAYHRAEAELWEHMALTRARVLAGDAAFAEEAAAAIHSILAQPRSSADVFRRVGEMRELVAREKGEQDFWDLKLAAGGIMDLDFLAQALVLTHASEHPSLLGQGTPGVIAEAGRAGILAPDAAARLAEAHRVLDDVAHWQRLTVGETQGEAAPPAMLRRLAALVGAPGPDELVARLGEIRTEVRTIFRAVLGEPSQR
ncbi:bifunctional [glutamine synthetase] adenylyltransferase/[glutamine synthetase]-adenylyl-L-tyrosine phosphorylase [Enterovirga aerilata]|uniref:Bifunctional glutamine synthetase adenylyltransferase/adenylyl-removing enzyme n=1 Tax=Enterovirga aerilata TaxID=2730920 RepID=A0A849I0U8_9HYPH|nr:bifunctional [glutamine synthetase] adenylyltransferase/[glutamine synthetase]-adenylyl-L-tyrosine phosphorylase [Enterovirga sp. DB1703]NNM73386.1 bifunctional [glutamine synthetase] adenylyltransferase/[glutamine synthetase]-adenylyl-L-tyrosine phosphorylase [Enterovirga sp. DB1703]